MTIYQYKAISRTGEQISGEIEAAAEKIVFEELDKLGLYPVRVVPSVKPASAGSVNSLPFIGAKPDGTKITLFTRELSMLIGGGVPLDKALTILIGDTNSPRIKKLAEQLLKSINDGQSFYQALENTGGVFPPVYISMIKVAEASGTLEVVLEKLAETREKEQKLRSKALSSLLYPCLLVFTAIGAIIVMLVYVVPGFRDLILNAGGEIPDSSRIVIGASDWLIAYGMTLLQVLAAGIALMMVLWRNRSFRQSLDSFMFHLPVTGHLMRLGLTVRFCRTMGTLLENGVDLPGAMTLTKDVLGNRSAEAVIGSAGDALRKGQNFLDPLASAKIFPSIVINILRVGDETGNLAKSSLFLADMFEEKLDTTVQRIFTIMEPLIIMLVSIFVAGIIISIIGSVLSINDLAA